MTERTLPTIHLNGAETCLPLRVDRLAQFGHQAMLVSCVGHATSVKALTASLQTGHGSLGTKQIKDMPTVCVPFPDGYRIARHHLGLDAWHVVAVANDEKLLLSGDDATLWAALRSSRFTTPLLREWTPWLRTQLVRYKRLHQIPGHNTDCWWLTAETEDLDAIVSAGIKRREIVIE